MNYIFDKFGIGISEDCGTFYLTTDSGGSASWEITTEISKEDAQIAQKSEQDAYKICLKYKNSFIKSKTL